MYISKYGSKLNLHYCEAQARTGKGWPLRRKALKLKLSFCGTPKCSPKTAINIILTMFLQPTMCLMELTLCLLM